MQIRCYSFNAYSPGEIATPSDTRIVNLWYKVELNILHSWLKLWEPKIYLQLCAIKFRQLRDN